jgi:hypothetical protein
MSFDPLVEMLQVAVSPVILISAVGLLLLTMNNRLAHAIDKARHLVKEAQSASEDYQAHIRGQVEVIWLRTRFIKNGIVLASVSALSAALLIIAMFVGELLGLPIGWFIIALFIISLSALSFSLLFLILDVNKSLIALKLELEWNGAHTG